MVLGNLLMALGQAFISYCFGSAPSVSSMCFENDLTTSTGPLRLVINTLSVFYLLASMLQFIMAMTGSAYECCVVCIENSIAMHRSMPLPVLVTNLQNATSIFIPSSVVFTTVISADFYYLIYYQDTEVILKGGKALDIVQVKC